MMLLLAGIFVLPQQSNAQTRDHLLPNEKLIVLHRIDIVRHVKTSCETAAFVLSAPVCESPGELRDSTCLEMKALDAICKSSSSVLSDEVRSFEDEVLAQLGVNSACKGVVIAQLEGPDTKLPEAIDHRMGKEGTWGLAIDFTHGAPTQEWKMAMATSSSVTKGEGDPKAIARDICSVAAGRGHL
jgi:hypothetical protein